MTIRSGDRYESKETGEVTVYGRCDVNDEPTVMLCVDESGKRSRISPDDLIDRFTLVHAELIRDVLWSSVPLLETAQ